MNKWFKAAALGIAMLAGGLMPTSTFAAESSVRVEVNGSEVQFPDAKPFVTTEGRTMVPVRFISTTLGYNVDWDNSVQKIKIQKGQKKVALGINQTSIQVNNQQESLDAPATISNDRTYVPLRFVAEALGQPVYWEPVGQTAAIGKAPVAASIPTIDAVATAYSSESGNLDYFGNPLQLGTVAVDPNVIPLGSKLYITGYSYDGLPVGGMYAVATDIGGAIKGNRVDIYIPGTTPSSVRQFGMQNVKIQILK